MTPRLIEKGPQGDILRETVVQKEEFLIGRGTDCDLRLTGTDISRHHCLLQIRGGEITLSDLGSSNGTLLNGKIIRCPMPIQSGDEIQVGNFGFLVDLGDNPEIMEKIEKSANPMATTRKISWKDRADLGKPGKNR